MQTPYRLYKSTHRIHFVDRQQTNVKKILPSSFRMYAKKSEKKTQEQGKKLKQTKNHPVWVSF